MRKVSIQTQGDRLWLASPFYPAMPPKARALGGDYDGETRRWSFDARDEDRVRALAIEIYGTDGTPTETVTVRLALDEAYTSNTPQTIYLAGWQVAHRLGRDAAVRLGEGVITVAGGFPGRGGSVKNPRLEWEPGTVLEVRDLPAGHADLTDAGVTVLGEPVVDRAALAAERERLATRIAEIGRLLGAQGG
jgi:hypothetical protein